MEQVECEITELPVAWCAHCKKLLTPEEEAAKEEEEFYKQWERWTR